MNIMFLIFSYNIGGIERLLIDMSNELSHRGHHVHLCVINHDYSTDLLNNYSNDITVHLLNKTKGSRGFLKYMVQLSRLVKRNNINILHCQEINCVIFSLFTKLSCPGISILDTVHDTHIYTEYPSWKIFIEKIFCKKVIAISESVKSEILSRNIPESQIQVIYNAIDTSKFQVKSSKSLDSKAIRLGNVARIMPQKKGQFLLLEAIAELKKDYPAIHCDFAGGVSPKYQSEYQKLLDYIESHQLTNNITFCGSMNDIPSFLDSINIFILPSYYEGFGIALIEAMAAGLPCIASNIDGPKEIISDSNLGVLFESGNVSDLVYKIKEVIEHYSSYDPNKISAYISSKFSMPVMIDNLLSLYHKL